VDQQVKGMSARQFWRDLDRLRRQRGLSYQRLARRTAVPHSTLQHWMTRRVSLAPWTDIQPVVAALDGSETEWFHRWKRADAHTTAPGVRPGEPAAQAQPTIAQAQLPMDIMEFTGREHEIRLLLDLLDGQEGTAVVIAAIEGMAGVGKTRLAVHIAHQLVSRGRGDQIQLYVDLQTHSGDHRPADPAAVLEERRSLLGVTGAQMPSGLPARAALYRARLDGKRAVVVLDDAADEDQVRPLLPGSPTCSVIVTSRRKLTGLDGTQPVTLPVLSADDALSLLSTIAGNERVRAEPDAAQAILDHCGRLPLAVTLAARRLRARPAWSLADLAKRLDVAASRLAELSASDRAVASAFAVSYDNLPPVQRSVFRLLALHPGTDFTATSAAALAATTPDDTEKLLEALLDEHLLEQTTHGRYRFHNLVHAFAHERVTAEEPAECRRTATTRLLTWYLYTAEQADRALVPHRRRLPLPPLAVPASLPAFSGYGHALRWFEAERNNLVAATDCAVANELDDIAWRIPASLYGFFALRKHRDEWVETHRTALSASRRIADPAAEAWVLNGLGIAHAECGRSARALKCFHRSLAISRQLGDRLSQGQVLNNIGETYRRRRRFPAAVEHYHQDLALCREIGDRHGEAVSLNNIGKVLFAMRRYEEALHHHREALDICHELGERCSAGETLNDLGDTHRGRSELDLAVEHYDRALVVRRDVGDLQGEAETLHNLGEVHESRHAEDTAISCYRKALTIWRSLGDQRAEEATLVRLTSLVADQ
jgi:tetratricopeptide (TPR) repeat protein/transcriptional regulator with XRE-family HTH domain